MPGKCTRTTRQVSTNALVTRCCGSRGGPKRKSNSCVFSRWIPSMPPRMLDCRSAISIAGVRRGRCARRWPQSDWSFTIHSPTTCAGWRCDACASRERRKRRSRPRCRKIRCSPRLMPNWLSFATRSVQCAKRRSTASSPIRRGGASRNSPRASHYRRDTDLGVDDRARGMCFGRRLAHGRWRTTRPGHGSDRLGAAPLGDFDDDANARRRRAAPVDRWRARSR